jgi:hypothetical protein
MASSDLPATTAACAWRVSLVVVLSVALAGCGEGGTKAREQGSAESPGERQGEGEQRPPPGGRLGEGIPPAERVVYYQLATTSGLIAAHAAPAVVGQGRPTTAPDRRELGSARDRLAALRPKDRRLAELRDRLLEAARRLYRVPTGRVPARRLARRVLSATTAANAGLRNYSQRHAGLGSLVPD